MTVPLHAIICMRVGPPHAYQRSDGETPACRSGSFHHTVPQNNNVHWHHYYGSYHLFMVDLLPSKYGNTLYAFHDLLAVMKSVIAFAAFPRTKNIASEPQLGKSHRTSDNEQHHMKKTN